MATFIQPFRAGSLPSIKEIASDIPPSDAVTLTRYLAVIDGEIRTLRLCDGEVEGYIGDSGRITPTLDLYASSGQDRDKGGRDPCKCEMYGHCLCSIVAGAIKGSCLIQPCEHGCVDGCPCQTCAGRKFVQLSQQGEIWAFEEEIVAWVDDEGDVRIRRKTVNDHLKLKIALPFPRVEYRSIDADRYYCDRCGANIAPFSRFDELSYVGADTHGIPLFHNCPNCGLESGGAIGGMESFTDDVNAPPLATWDGVRTKRPRVEKGKARVFPQNMRKTVSLPPHPRIVLSGATTVFISYSRSDQAHENWVHELAMRLESDGLNVKFDQTGIKPGNGIPKFMEKSIPASDFVLVICTPEYKNRYEAGEGGVAYEGNIIANAILRGDIKRDQVIPILRNDAAPDSIPLFIAGNMGVNLSDSNRYREYQYEELLQVLHGNRQ